MAAECAPLRFARRVFMALLRMCVPGAPATLGIEAVVAMAVAEAVVARVCVRLQLGG
jgi:hypothetical protein